MFVLSAFWENILETQVEKLMHLPSDSNFKIKRTVQMTKKLYELVRATVSRKWSRSFENDQTRRGTGGKASGRMVCQSVSIFYLESAIPDVGVLQENKMGHT